MKVLFIAAGGSFYGANRSMLALIVDLRERYNVDVRVAVVGQKFWKVSLENSPLVNALHESFACRDVRSFPILDEKKQRFVCGSCSFCNLWYIRKWFLLCIHESVFNFLGADSLFKRKE